MAEYDPKIIEPKWQKKWREEGVYEPDLDKAAKPFYNLMMFPYPSAEGLHVGNVYAFTGSDIYGRMKRMQGFDVFEPIGLDGFGIHSENYALKIGTHPMDQAVVSEERFYGQLEKIGAGFAWDERLETYKPEYYRWTQWIFAEMFRRGLAYRKKQSVNWCPKDLTVLADEQVENGKCERCGAEVIKKDLEQWFFKITAYADRLLANIKGLDWSEKVKIAQTNWIGRKEGIEITYPIDGTDETVTVFTTRPDTNFGATFIVIAPEHPLVGRIALSERKQEIGAYVASAAAKSDIERIAEGRKKTGVFTGCYAVNHLTGKKMPIWVSDFVLANFGTGAVVGVPGHDLRDFEFAVQFGIEIIRVVVGNDGDVSPIVRAEQVQEDEGKMINSGFLDGMDIYDATTAIMDHIEKNGWGKRVVQFRLRDWLISRQRYWGPPIPMIFCEACAKAGRGERSDMPGWYAVADKDLPVLLPRVTNFRPTGSGKSPLAAEKSFYEVPCPKCGARARRETDVSDTFLDSAWYYLRYLSPKDAVEPFDKTRAKKWLPAAMYTGGAEHAVLHLLYVRFLAMVLHDWKLVEFEEPFSKYRAQGLLIKDGAKMSKSKGNVVNPDEYITNFGADTLRMYLMFLAPFEQGGDFRDAGVLGVERFLKRVWKLSGDMGQVTSDKEDKNNKSLSPVTCHLSLLLHKTIKKVTEDIENLHYNTSVSALMILLRAFEGDESKVESQKSKGDFEIFLKLLAPFAPHITEEIWRETLGHTSSIHREPWPTHDPMLIREETFTLVFQVNGKTRDTMTASADITEDEAKAAAFASEKIKAAIGNVVPQKTIYVEKRLVNIVI
jgi:leucyl-tRNA synthetase